MSLFASFLLASLVAVGPDELSPADERARDVGERAQTDARAASLSVGRFLSFVENRGQWPEHVRFLCSSERTVVSVEQHGVTLQLLDPSGEALGSPGGVLVSLSFEDVSLEGDGERAERTIEGVERRRGTYNYFLGNDPSRWLTGIATFGGVRYRELQPGIDLVLRSTADGGLKYDVHVAPGADLSRLVVRCGGIEGLTRDHNDDLCIETALGAVAHARGASWEVLPDGTRRTVDCRERVLGERSFGFEVPDRDPSLPLVIDPGIVWSTYLGSSGGIVGDLAFAVATGANGDVTVVGKKDGPTFPATPGTFQSPGTSPQSVSDVFVTRLSGSDGSLLYSSTIGGASDQEEPRAVDVDAEGRATVVGRTFSPNFPTTQGAFDTTKGSFNDSVFVLRLSASGDRLLYSTLLEGAGFDASRAESVCVDRATGSTIVGGWATTGFPTTTGAWQENPSTLDGVPDGFVTRLDPTGSALEWSTYFGGTNGDEIHGVALDARGNVTVTGVTLSRDLPTTPGAFDTTLGTQVTRNAFVTRFDATGSSLIWSTYLGGPGPSTTDIGYAIASHPSGGVVVAGSGGPAFPTTPGSYQPTAATSGGFVARFADDGTLLHSTYVSGPGAEFINSMVVDGSGMPTFAGKADPGFPTTPGSLSPAYNGGAWDGYVARLDPSLSKLVYSSYVGGLGQDIAIGVSTGPTGRATLVGSTNGGYPTTPGTHSPTYNGGQTDGFVTTLDLYLQGIEPHGESTPACRGPLVANATVMPAAGVQGFAFYCTGAPPLSTGLLVFGPLRVSPARRLGVDVWIRPGLIVPVTSDADGYLEHSFPLTGVAQGAVASAQFFFRTTAECPGSGPWCASDAVRVTVQ